MAKRPNLEKVEQTQSGIKCACKDFPKWENEAKTKQPLSRSIGVLSFRLDGDKENLDI